MSIEAVFTKDAPAPITAYNQAIKAGGFVFISGVVGLTGEGKPVEGYEDIQNQTRQALSNLKAVVEAAGSSWEKIVKTNIYVTSLGDYDKINEIYCQFMTQKITPARSCVEVKGLPKGFNIEIEAIALA